MFERLYLYEVTLQYLVKKCNQQLVQTMFKRLYLHEITLQHLVKKCNQQLVRET